jgi:cytochrome d ubiquinol oxidase subunit II
VHLYLWPLLFVLAGLVLYVVLGGADFGAGFWQLTAGRGDDADELRDEAHHAIGPVWEANHVWLIFVLTVTWTAYPRALASIASTLVVPLFVAAVGIVFRGAAYALRAGAASGEERRRIDLLFSISSVLTPFALGTVVGGIASRRVPVGNARGSEWTSWLNATSITIGVLAIATSAYLAAVFLCADARRRGHGELERRFRLRALSAGAAAGALAVAALPVLAADAHPLFHRLVAGPGLAGLIVSFVAGCATLLLVLARRYEPARYTAATAVAAVVAGWALAQQPSFLRDLTIREAAAPRTTQIAVIVAVVAGGAILFPSLALLFRLTLAGRLGQGEAGASAGGPLFVRTLRPGLAARLALAAFVVGIGLLTVAGAPAAHAVGVVALLASIALGFGPLAGEERE